METAAKGADVLVHEALSPELVAVLRDAARDAGRRNLEQILKDIVGYHTTPEQAAGIASRAGVGTLLLHHIVPALPLRALEGPFLGKARKLFSGPVVVGRDGDVLSMPAGGKAVIHSNPLR